MRILRLYLLVLLILGGLCACRDTVTVALDESFAVLDLSGRNDASRSSLHGATHALEAMGIPFFSTDNLTRAARSQVIVAAGNLTEDTFDDEERSILKGFVESGGVLVGGRLSDPELFGLFGIWGTEKSKQRFSLTFNDEALAHPFFHYIDHENEQQISLGDERYEEVFYTTGYRVSTGESFGAFDDNQTAVVLHSFDNGTTLLLGCKFSDLITRPQTNRDYEAQRIYSNGFEPSADVIALLLRGIYEQTVALPVLKHPIPQGRAGALIITHDVDATAAFANSIDFMEQELNLGLKSSYNITTKYTGSAYYNEESVVYIQQLKEAGFDIQSHSVGHFLDFNALPEGDPQVSFETYAPYREAGVTYDATVYGEVKVSKELLDRDIPLQDTLAFRSGHLLFHDSLAEILEDSGYQYSSCHSANDVLSNFPFYLMLNNSMSAERSTILEIPMTISDRHLTEDNVQTTVDGWIEVLEANMANNAVTSLLIHTSRTEYKLEAQRRLLEAVQDYDLWIGDQLSFGEFWRQRTSIDVTVERVSSDGGRTHSVVLHLDVSADELKPGLTFVIIDGEQALVEVQVKDIQGEAVLTQTSRQADRMVVVVTGAE